MRPLRQKNSTTSVYCAGLFDYLSDKVATRLLEYLNSRTRPGGRILVTNVHPCNQQRGVMDHVLEWHLIYRDEAQLVSVLPAHRCDEKIYTDTTGCERVRRVQRTDRAGPGE